MKTTVLNFLNSLKPETVNADILIDESKDKTKIVYKLYNRVLLSFDCKYKNWNRLEFFNYQKNNKDIKEMIHLSYPIKETAKESQRLITIDILKGDDEFLSVVKQLESVMKEKIMDIFLNYSPIMVFGCCSKCEQCSDEKKCVIADKDPVFARGCQYRHNLENGRIFYGKNRNV